MYKGFKGCNFIFGGGHQKFPPFLLFKKLVQEKKLSIFIFIWRGDGTINFLELFFSKLIRGRGGGVYVKVL
jgi:hypothetical protein